MPKIPDSCPKSPETYSLDLCLAFSAWSSFPTMAYVVLPTFSCMASQEHCRFRKITRVAPPPWTPSLTGPSVSRRAQRHGSGCDPVLQRAPRAPGLPGPACPAPDLPDLLCCPRPAPDAACAPAGPCRAGLPLCTHLAPRAASPAAMAASILWLCIPASGQTHEDDACSSSIPGFPMYPTSLDARQSYHWSTHKRRLGIWSAALHGKRRRCAPCDRCSVAAALC